MAEESPARDSDRNLGARTSSLRAIAGAGPARGHAALPVLHTGQGGSLTVGPSLRAAGGSSPQHPHPMEGGNLEAGPLASPSATALLPPPVSPFPHHEAPRPRAGWADTDSPQKPGKHIPRQPGPSLLWGSLGPLFWRVPPIPAALRQGVCQVLTPRGRPPPTHHSTHL